MGGKFSHKLEVLPWMLLNRNFLKENRHYPHAGWEKFCAKIFSKLLLGQCINEVDETTILTNSIIFIHNPLNNQINVQAYLEGKAEEILTTAQNQLFQVAAVRLLIYVVPYLY